MKKGLLILLFTLSVSFILVGQNILKLTDKKAGKEYKIRIGDRIKIKALNNNIYRGRIKDIQDSSIVIKSMKSNEIYLKEIKYIYYRKDNFLKTIPGFFLVPFEIFGPTLLINSAIYPSSFFYIDVTLQNLLLYGVIPVCVLTPVVYYLLFYRKKFDVVNNYELKIVKCATKIL